MVICGEIKILSVILLSVLCVVELCLAYLSNSRCEVLNKKLAEVVQGVELTSLQYEGRGEIVQLKQLESI